MRSVSIVGALLIAVLLLPLILIGSVLGELAAATPATTTSPPGSQLVGDLPAPVPAEGTGSGCTASDPTGGRCLTPTMRHAYDEIARVFGAPGGRGPLRSAGCWDAHAWNPTSDHPLGKACDFFPTAAGTFPGGQELQNGWRLAEWLRAHAAELRVSYIIWQGRIWTAGEPDVNGWGRPYTGGGVYNPNDATGGHYDHVHLSVER